MTVNYIISQNTCGAGNKLALIQRLRQSSEIQKMKNITSIICFLFAALICKADYSLQEIYVERYTDVDGATYKHETGTLSAAGFVALTNSGGTYNDKLNLAGVKVVEGKNLIAVASWQSLNTQYNSAALLYFSKETTLYTISGVSYYSVTWAGKQLNANVRFVNQSYRAVIPAGGYTIAGFVVDKGPAKIMVRAGGPALARVGGISGTMADPAITLYSGSTPLFTNDNWCDTDLQKTEIIKAQSASGAFAYEENSKDAALCVTLDSGPYTVIVRSADGKSAGEVLVEVYSIPQ